MRVSSRRCVSMIVAAVMVVPAALTVAVVIIYNALAKQHRTNVTSSLPFPGGSTAQRLLQQIQLLGPAQAQPAALHPRPATVHVRASTAHILNTQLPQLNAPPAGNLGGLLPAARADHDTVSHLVPANFSVPMAAPSAIRLPGPPPRATSAVAPDRLGHHAIPSTLVAAPAAKQRNQVPAILVAVAAAEAQRQREQEQQRAMAAATRTATVPGNDGPPPTAQKVSQPSSAPPPVNTPPASQPAVTAPPAQSSQGSSTSTTTAQAGSQQPVNSQNAANTQPASQTTSQPVPAPASPAATSGSSAGPSQPVHAPASPAATSGSSAGASQPASLRISGPRDFAVALLKALGDPVTSQNIQAIVSWERKEGGAWANRAAFNPLNTTLRMPGSHAVNAVGVQAYTSWSQGLSATVKTLKGGGYGAILAALRTGSSALAVERAVAASPWGTGSFSLV